MVILSCESLGKSFGTDLLFDKVSFHINNNDKIGLVGANGTGKSTLFKLLSSELVPDSGQVHFSKDSRLGYMSQHVGLDETHSIYAEVLSVFDYFKDMEHELSDLHDLVEQGHHEYIDKQLMLTEKYENLGGLTYKSRTKSALLRLGFKEDDMEKPLCMLSGGERSKISLARLLLSDAKLLLLDEPTNHLDIDSILWLEEFLQGYGGAYIIISHDRYFLDRVTKRTFELEYNKLTVYNSNYSGHLDKKEENKRVLEHQYKSDIKEIKRIEAIIEQQRRWNREKNIKTAESKQKQVDKLVNELVVPDSDLDTLNFKFNVPFCPTNDILLAHNLSKSFENRKLFDVEKIHITKGERVFLLGANGCGKTTLFKILIKELRPDSGTITFGTSVLHGYYDQRLSGLNLNKTALDQLWDNFPHMTQTQIRTALAIFLFKGDSVFKPINALSGGERARIALLTLMLSKANFLLLDEPTNHLDIPSREALEEALKSYDGTLFIISHDRYFINKMADRVLYLSESGISEYLGNYDFYTEHSKSSVNQSNFSEGIKKTAVKTNDYKLKKEAESTLRKKAGLQKRLEENIEAKEKEIAALNEQLLLPDISCDYNKITEITKQLDDENKQLEKLYEEWEEVIKTTDL